MLTQEDLDRGPPKGWIAAGEDPLTAAKREFTEETGHSPRGEQVPLGEGKQPGGKIVHVWAVEDDWYPEDINSNMFRDGVATRPGRRQTFPGARPRRVVCCYRGADKIL
jgi:predicted NUDIX family NTP pyrophosphohydrolase